MNFLLLFFSFMIFSSLSSEGQCDRLSDNYNPGHYELNTAGECVLKPCVNRVVVFDKDPNRQTLVPCGSNDCFWDMGSGSNRCITEDMECTNKGHFDKTMNALDQLFLIDATGSMYDTINTAFLQVKNLSTELQTNYPHIQFRFGCVCYRDNFSSPLDIHQTFDFSQNITELENFLGTVTASGGGDGPEDVAGAFELGLELSWVDYSLKTITLIADAPPRMETDQVTRLEGFLQTAARRNMELTVLSLNGGMDYFKTFINDTYVNEGKEVEWYWLSASQIYEMFIAPTITSIEDKLAHHNHTCRYKSCVNRTSVGGSWGCGPSDESNSPGLCLENTGRTEENKGPLCTLSCSNDAHYKPDLSTGKCVLKPCEERTEVPDPEVPDPEVPDLKISTWIEKLKRFVKVGSGGKVYTLGDEGGLDADWPCSLSPTKASKGAWWWWIILVAVLALIAAIIAAALLALYLKKRQKPPVVEEPPAYAGICPVLVMCDGNTRDNPNDVQLRERQAELRREQETEAEQRERERVAERLRTSPGPYAGGGGGGYHSGPSPASAGRFSPAPGFTGSVNNAGGRFSPGPGTGLRGGGSPSPNGFRSGGNPSPNGGFR